MTVKQNPKLCVDHAFSHSAFEKEVGANKQYLE